MSSYSIKDIIEEGRLIKKGLRFVPSSPYVMRMYSVYAPSDVDKYYCWKECAIRFLHLYYPIDQERFVKYSEEFEKNHFVPQYLSNMIGVLEACETFPSDQMKQEEEERMRDSEIESVVKLEEDYRLLTRPDVIHTSSSAFHAWHAAACVLFDKWFYPTDDDWVIFQNIEGDGNGYSLKHEYDKIYSPYKKLLARLRERRSIRGSALSSLGNRSDKSIVETKKVSIFISYSHSDEKWLQRLKKHLTVITRFSDSIEYWEDTKLKGGDKWREEINEAIDKANVAILLVSTDFLASDFITCNELPPILKKAQKDGTCIIPLIVAPCDFEDSVLSEFQAINNPEQTLADLIHNDAAIDRVYLELIRQIKGML